MIPQSNRKIQLTSAVLLVILCAGWTAKGIKENLEHNDFDVIRMGAELALDRSAGIYDAKLQVKDRHFVYPPAAAILLIPMALPPLKLAAVATAVLKGVMLAVLVWLCASVERGNRGRIAAAPVALAGLLILFRPIDNDFGNGQVNIHLALLVSGGLLMMLYARSATMKLFGAVLFSVGVVVKPPPGLLAGALLLHKKWIPLAAVVLLLPVIFLGLPPAWFGPALSRQLFAEYGERTDRMLFGAKDGDQVSLFEAVVFCSTQAGAPSGLELDDEKLYIRENGERRRFKLDDPFSAGTAKAVFLLLAVGGGLAFLGMRRHIFRGRAPSPAWDASTLCVFCVLLSPLARKAHVVILLLPVCWILGRVAADAASAGWKGWLWSNPLDGSLLMLATAGFWASDDVPIPVPGFPMPLRPMLLVAQIAILALLWRVGHREAASVSQSPA